MTFACPVCGTSLASRVDPATLAAALPLTRDERRVFDELLERFGRYVTTRRLIEIVWFDEPDGEPNWPDACISQLVSRLRARIEPYGLVIEGKQGGGAGRRMTWSAH